MTYNKWLEIAAALDLNHAIIGEQNAKTDAEREECRRVAQQSQKILKEIVEKQNIR